MKKEGPFNQAGVFDLAHAPTEVVAMLQKAREDEATRQKNEAAAQTPDSRERARQQELVKATERYVNQELKEIDGEIRSLDNQISAAQGRGHNVIVLSRVEVPKPAIDPQKIARLEDELLMYRMQKDALTETLRATRGHGAIPADLAAHLFVIRKTYDKKLVMAPTSSVFQERRAATDAILKKLGYEK